MKIIKWQCDECGASCQGYDYDFLREIAEVHCRHGCKKMHIRFIDYEFGEKVSQY
jgi:hypothetical protein